MTQPRVLPAMEQRAESSAIGIAVFLAIALVMVVIGVAWLAFGPPLT